MALTIAYEYRNEDEAYRSQRIYGRAGEKTNFWSSKYGIGVIVILLLMIGLVWTDMLNLFAALAIVSITVFALRRQWGLSIIYEDEASPAFGHKTCTLDEQGIGIESDTIRTWLAWKAVRDIEETSKHIMVFYDLIRSLAIPKAGFKSPEEQAQFIAYMAQHVPDSKIEKVDEKKPAAHVTWSGSSSAWSWGVWGVMMLLVLYYSYGITSSSYAVPRIEMMVDDTKRVEDGVILLGTAKNIDSTDWQVGVIQIRFFDKDGKFIDQCETYATTLSVKAGASERFKIGCMLPRDRSQQYGDYGLLMPDTLKHFDRAEARVKSGYDTGYLSILK